MVGESPARCQQPHEDRPAPLPVPLYPRVAAAVESEVSRSGVEAAFGLETLGEDGDEVVLALAGEFDLDSGPELTRVLGELRDRRARSIVVDLAATSFVDASTLGQFVAALEWLDPGGGELVFASPRPQVRRILALTKLDSRFRVFASRAAALERHVLSATA
jgi:anti-sigma B factor antagonist